MVPLPCDGETSDNPAAERALLIVPKVIGVGPPGGDDLVVGLYRHRSEPIRARAEPELASLLAGTDVASAVALAEAEVELELGRQSQHPGGVKYSVVRVTDRDDLPVGTNGHIQGRVVAADIRYVRIRFEIAWRMKEFPCIVGKESTGFGRSVGIQAEQRDIAVMRRFALSRSVR